MADLARDYIKTQLATEAIDGSHDFFHIDRVIKLSETIAKAEGEEDGLSEMLCCHG